MGGFNFNEIEIKNLSTLYRSSIPQIDDYNINSQIDYNSYIIGTNAMLFSPHSGCRISALDLLKIVELLLNKGKYFDGVNYIKILNETTVDLMLQPTWEYNGSNGDNFFGIFNKWGLGLQITTNTKCEDIVFGNEVLYGHIGQAYGLIADMYFNFNHNKGFVFIVNGYYDETYDVGQNSAFLKIEEEVFNSLEDEFDYLCDFFNKKEFKSVININNYTDDILRKQSKTIRPIK